MTVRRGDERAVEGRIVRQCAYCRRETSTGDGCTSDTIPFPDGAVAAAIPYGEETLAQFADRCRGCGAPRGSYHHPFCPVEECPRCGQRLMRCGCLDTDRVSRRWPE